MKLAKLLNEQHLTISCSEANRKIKVDAVFVNGERITDIASELEVKAGDVIQVGRKVVKIGE